jgi:hypothetical protein
MSIPPEIRTYLIQIMEDAHVKDITDEEREDAVYQMFLRLDNYIAGRLIDSFPTTEECDVFIQMNRDNKSQAEINRYLQERIPGLNDLMAQIFIDFRNFYVLPIPRKK